MTTYFYFKDTPHSTYSDEAQLKAAHVNGRKHYPSREACEVDAENGDVLRTFDIPGCICHKKGKLGKPKFKPTWKRKKNEPHLGAIH